MANATSSVSTPAPTTPTCVQRDATGVETSIACPTAGDAMGLLVQAEAVSAIKQVNELMTEATATIGEAKKAVKKVNGILDDVDRVKGSLDLGVGSFSGGDTRLHAGLSLRTTSFNFNADLYPSPDRFDAIDWKADARYAIGVRIFEDRAFSQGALKDKATLSLGAQAGLRHGALSVELPVQLSAVQLPLSLDLHPQVVRGDSGTGFVLGLGLGWTPSKISSKVTLHCGGEVALGQGVDHYVGCDVSGSAGLAATLLGLVK